MLAGRAAEAERARRMPVDVARALDDAGMFSLLRPRRYGGHQVDTATYIDVLIELARGDGSVGWLASQINNAQWIAEQLGGLRDEVLTGPRSNIASVLFGQSTVRRTDGGYILDGRWGFCSGCLQADWVFMAAAVIDEGAPPTMGFFAVPASALQIEDDWQPSGLAATGSHSIAARALFVPERLFAGIVPLVLNTVTLAEVDAPMYRAAMMPFITVTAGAIAVGMAEAMVAEFKAQLPGRPLAYTTYASRAEAPTTHMVLGEAVAKIKAARLLFHDAAATIEREAATNEPMAVPLRIATRTQGVLGIRLCQEAVDSLLRASGARALQLANPLQRIDRDLRALGMHPVYMAETAFEFLGRCELGMPPNTMFP
jgi:alkylation response protein AidB-like acyl-CoA dehydrogenase